ncbi:MAG: Crp/Fnr family transcriptional regulator [Clostridia bacterium]
MDNKDILSKLSFWNNLTDNEKETAVRGSVVKTYNKGTYIYGFTDACLGFVYVKKGSIRVYITSDEGREITLFHIAEGDKCILSSACALSGVLLDVQMVAEEDIELLAIGAGTFEKLAQSNIYVKSFAYELTSKRLSSVVWILEQILFSHFDSRMAQFLISAYERTGEKTIKMTQETIAREVNSAREVVARMLKQFENDGIISIKRGTITIKDLNALEKIAN